MLIHNTWVPNRTHKVAFELRRWLCRLVLQNPSGQSGTAGEAEGTPGTDAAEPEIPIGAVQVPVLHKHAVPM